MSEYFSVIWLGNLAMTVFSALAIMFVTLVVAKWVKNRIITIGLRYEELDNTLFSFLGSIARALIMVFGGIVILNRFGVQTTSIIALVGAAGLAIGLALQGTLSNFAAGVMLIIFHPFKRDDYITVAGESGTVKEITIFTTELATPNNIQIIIPNAQIWGSAITNYSAHATRRADFVFGVSYSSDLKKAEKILRGLIAKDKRIHADPEPLVKVSNLGDSSVDFRVRVWVDSADNWNVKYDLTRQVKDAFDAGGIVIPFPTTTMIQVQAKS